MSEIHPAPGQPGGDPVGKQPPIVLTTVECRAELARFVRMLEGHLTQTDYKAHWRTVETNYLRSRLVHEFMEWQTERRRVDEKRRSAKPHHEIHELLDIAAFCMMTVDSILEGLDD